MADVAPTTNNLDQPLNPDGTPQATMKERVAKKLKWGCGGCILVVFVATWLMQGFIYWYATIGCSESSMDPYSSNATGAINRFGDGNANIMPPQLGLRNVDDASVVWPSSEAFDISEETIVGLHKSATIGTWNRYWGPVFDTYSYQEFLTGKVTMYMRRNLMRLGMSHRIGRCDSKGPLVTMDEGGTWNWVANRFRAIFKSQKSMILDITLDDTVIGTASEKNLDENSITIDGVKGEDGNLKAEDKDWASATNDMDNKDLWHLNFHPSSKIPTWALSGMVLLYADYCAETAKAAEVKSKDEAVHA